MNRHCPRPALAVLFFGLAAVVAADPGPGGRKGHNSYDPKAFPAQVSERVFVIPLDPSGLMAVVPSSMAAMIPDLDARFKTKSGVSIPLKTADSVRAEDLRGKHLILAGNIMNNPWVLEMYMKRLTYADAYFPGKGGFHIHPAKSVWDGSKNVLVVGSSADADLGPAWEAFLGALPAIDSQTRLMLGKYFGEFWVTEKIRKK